MKHNNQCLKALSGVLFVLFVLTGASGFAQEVSVKPGINDNFQNPDVERYVNMFEGESRTIFKTRNEIVETMGIEEGMDVADIGAGTGFFSRMMSYQVGKKGTVFAVDIAENFVAHIDNMADEEGIKNIRAKVCTERSVELKKNSIDLAFICDVYHHFEYPYDSMASIHKALRPGGRVMIVDFERVVGVSSEWTLGHIRCGKGTVTDEMADSGFDFVEEVDLGMGDQWARIYRKRG